MTADVPSLKIRIAVAPRRASFPADDDALGEALFARVLAAEGKGFPPAVVVVRSDVVWTLDLRPFLKAALPVHAVIASLAGMPDVEAVAFLGGVTRRDSRAGERVGAPGAAPSSDTSQAESLAGVFVEWRDGRWWGCFQPVTPEARWIATDSRDVLRARDGLARPRGLGGWFSRARFEGLCAQFTPTPELPAPPDDGWVN